MLKTMLPLVLNLAIGAASAAGPSDPWSAPTMTADAASDPIRDRIERLSAHEVKQFYLGCSQSAMRGRLDGAGAGLCSIGYDVLLKRHFGGDFHALLAWSRNQDREGDSGIGAGSD